jgi:RNA polymerase sigma-70 factor (ECF subfamily)
VLLFLTVTSLNRAPPPQRAGRYCPPMGERARTRIAAGRIRPEPTPRVSIRARVPRAGRLVRVLRVGLSALPRALAPAATTPRSPAAGGAFDAFYRGNYASVVRLAYSLCGSLQIAEELAQEAFVTAHQRWERLGGFDRPDLWVRRVVINRSISFRRREATERRALEQLHDRDATGTTVDLPIGDAELWAALRELSPRQAEALALFYVEDQPISEVAKILGLGEETVKTHLKRGRAALAERLAERERR